MKAPDMRVLALLLSAAATAPIHAQEPTRVGVEVKLVDAKYVNHFRVDPTDVERRLTTEVSRILADEIGFVRFVPGGNEQYRLRVTLDRSDTLSTNHFVDRGVRVTLIHPNASGSTFWLKLLDANDSWKNLTTVEALVRDIELAAKRNGFGRIVELLREVPVSNEALWIGDSNGWALPLRPETLCVRHGTLLAVLNDESTASVNRFIRYDSVTVTGSAKPTVPVPFRGGVFGEPPRPVGAQGNVREVFVTQYRRDDNCSRQPAGPRTGAGGAS